MATSAQIEANRENAQKSSGPTSEAGRQTSSQNNFRHGLTGHLFVILDWEEPEAYEELQNDLTQEYQPQTATERILVQKMAQQHWLSQRAQTFHTLMLTKDDFNDKTLETMLRYQTMHDRLFQRALHDLLKLRAEKGKAEIGFESQKRSEAQEKRRENNENRKVECHSLRVEIDKQHLEREKTANLLKAAKVNQELDGMRPPEMVLKAA